MRPSRLLAGLAALAISSFPVEASVKDAVDIGTRVEMLIDNWLVEKTDGLSLRLAQPERREIVWQAEEPWEDTWCAYFTVLRDGGKVRLYYRASMPGKDLSEFQYTCVAESSDGIRFTRRTSRLVEFEGSRGEQYHLEGCAVAQLRSVCGHQPAREARGAVQGDCECGGRNPTRPGQLYALPHRTAYTGSSAARTRWTSRGRSTP